MTFRMMTAAGALVLGLGLATTASAQQGMQPGMGGGGQMQQGGMQQGGMGMERGSMRQGGMTKGMRSKSMKKKKMMKRGGM